MNSRIIILLAIFSNFLSQILFSKLSMIKNLDFSTIEKSYNYIVTLVFDLQFWFAILFFILGSLLWVIGLKKVPLTIAFSYSSINYVFVMFYSILNLHVPVNIFMIGSCFLIVIGILLIMNSEELMFNKKNK